MLPVAAKYIKPNVSSSCRIKGNVSINTGERIYHVPGQTYYDDTRISFQYGERWFCTEAEARAAGWRRSRT
ncbi:sunset domain-containing protein [Aliirhizobium terrae]|uniref:sunset domain-containing protein n=1 Tax=Terrirhizobium terrae TaxID=2926709 RepID=UPI004042BEFD